MSKRPLYYMALVFCAVFASETLWRVVHAQTADEATAVIGCLLTTFFAGMAVVRLHEWCEKKP